jgi:ankyrin repeat protein
VLDIFRSQKETFRFPTNTRHIILYYAFDRWDVRRSSVNDMLRSFIAQAACRPNSLMRKDVFDQLEQSSDWSEPDLYHWFECFRKAIGCTVLCIVQHFDHCNDASRKKFLDVFARIAENSEGIMKMVVTNRKLDGLAEEFQQYPPHMVSTVGSEPEETDQHLSASEIIESDVSAVSRLWPEALGLFNLYLKELGSISYLDIVSRQVIEVHLVTRPYLTDEIIKSIIHHLTGGLKPDRSLAEILNTILESIPDPRIRRQLVTWLLYCVRPLTKWELAAVLSLRAQENWHEPTDTTSTITKIKTWLGGIAAVKRIEVRCPARLRQVMMTEESNGPQPYVWQLVKSTAHYEIAEDCIDFLCLDSTQDQIRKACESFGCYDEDSPPTNMPDRTQFWSYAVMALPRHLSHVPSEQSPSKLAGKITPQLGKLIANAFWAFSNPITRSEKPLDSMFQVLAGEGAIELFKPRDDLDISMGMTEAARHGRKDIVKALLKQRKHPLKALLGALKASRHGVEESIMLDLIDSIISRAKKGHASVEWPQEILARASWLGFDTVVEKLLTLGCSPNPAWTAEDTPLPRYPLHLAIHRSHASTCRILLKHKANLNTTTRNKRLPLHIAAMFSSPEVIRILVEEGCGDIEAQDEFKFTPLYLAAMFERPNAVRELLRYGADPNMEQRAASLYWTPLAVAADDGSAKVVEALLEANAKPNIAGISGINSPLLHAAAGKHLKICRLLLEAGADPCQWDLEGRGREGPMARLIRSNILDASSTDSKLENVLELMKLLIEHGATVNEKTTWGPLLLMAVRSRRLPILKFILDQGADVHATDGRNWTALHVAASLGLDEAVKLLLEKGADINSRTDEGETALHLSTEDNDVVSLLLENGADPDACDTGGASALIKVVDGGTKATMELLLHYKASLEISTNTTHSDPGWTAIFFAVRYGTQEMIRLLAEAGADLNHKDLEGLTPLHIAITNEDRLNALLEFQGRIDISQIDNGGNTPLHRMTNAWLSLESIKRFVFAGGDVNVQNENGQTPLLLASDDEREEVVKFYLQQGADINLFSTFLGGPLHRACRYFNTGLAKLLIEHKADVNLAVSGHFGTPLQAICLSNQKNADGRLETYELLIRHGAEVNKRGGLFNTTLAAASLGFPTTLLKRVLDDSEPGTVHVKDHIGRLPIHFAATRGIDHIKTIIDAGGDILSKDNMNCTPLHWASMTGRVKIVSYILSLVPLGAANEADMDGWTPLTWATRPCHDWMPNDFVSEESDRMATVDLLLKHGADPAVKSMIGGREWPPIRLAKYYGTQPGIVQLLEDAIGGEKPKGASQALESEDDDESFDSVQHQDTSEVLTRTESYCDACLWVSSFLPSHLIAHQVDTGCLCTC